MSNPNDDRNDRRDDENSESNTGSQMSEEQLSMLIGRLPSPSQSNDHGYHANGFGRANYDLVNNA